MAFIQHCTEIYIYMKDVHKFIEKNIWINVSIIYICVCVSFMLIHKDTQAYYISLKLTLWWSHSGTSHNFPTGFYRLYFIFIYLSGAWTFEYFIRIWKWQSALKKKKSVSCAKVIRD